MFRARRNFALANESGCTCLDQTRRSTRIAMTGHSFGALTTMALAGVRYPGPIKSLAEPRIKAFIAFSPSVQGLKRSLPERYGEMARPFLSVTGTIDGDVMSTGSNAKNRAALFDTQPAGDNTA